MSLKSITLSVVAYERLKNAKQAGESFSDVVLREIPKRAKHFKAGAGKHLLLKGAKPLSPEPILDEFKET